MIRRRSYARILSLVGLAALPGAWLETTTSPASAADLEWTNPATTGLLVFNTPGNWTPAQTPTLDDNLLFQIDNAAAPILLNAGSLSNDFTVADFRWVFSGLTSGDLTTDNVALIDDPLATSLLDGARVDFVQDAVWNIGDGIGTTFGEPGLLRVGDTGFGVVRIDTGSEVSAEVLIVGAQNGGVGEVTVDGAGATLTATRIQNAGNHVIGDNGGTGVLNVNNGAQLLTTSTDANDIHVGRGVFDDGVNPVVRSVGTLNIDGVGSFAETEDFYVGYLGGDGRLNITGGGQVVLTDGNSSDFSLGRNVGSIGAAVIDGDGSLLSARHIDLGEQGGAATLAIRNGGRVETRSDASDTDADEVRGDMFIATDAGSQATVAVYGSGANPSTLQADLLYVGNVGLGELRVGRDLSGTFLDGGRVIATSIIVGDVDGNDADNRLVVDGPNAQVTTSGAIVVGDAGRGVWESLNGSTTTAGTSFNVGVRDGSVSTALFDGAGTTLTAANLFVGNGTGVGSTGAATFRNGATATLIGSFATNDAGGGVTLGDDDEGIGTLNIEGIGSRVETTNSTWFIGGSENENGGTGIAHITAGGVGISSGRVWMGYRAGANGTLNVTGPGSRFDANGDFILVGFQGNGFLNIEDGGVVNANSLVLGDEPGSAGSAITVDGAGSQLNLTRRLTVGDQDDTTMVVSGGAVVNVATNPGAAVDNQRLIIGRAASGNDSSLTVTGAGSTVNYFGGERISVGFQAGAVADRNELRVLDGGVVRAFRTDAANPATQGFMVLGDEANGHGELLVDGPGSLVDVRHLNIGEQTSASGVVNVRNGGVVQVADFSEVGAAGDGDNFLTVEGVGSRYETGGDLSVAAGSSTLRVDGEMRIRDGGVVETGRFGFIGRASTNVGRADIGGPGALATWNVADTFYMAGNTDVANPGGSQSSGSATLNLLENGRINVGGNFYLKDRGTISLTGGELIANDLIFLDFGGSNYTPVPTVNWGTGLIRYTTGAVKTLSNFDLDILFDGGPYELDAGKHLAIDGLLVPGAEIRIDGGELSIGSMSQANFQNFIDFDAGTLNLTNAGLVVAANGLLGAVAVIDGDETLNVTSSVIVQNGGLLNVAGGTFSMGGGVIDPGGTLVVASGAADFDADSGGSALTNNGDLVLIDAVTTGTITNNADLTLVNTVLGGSLINNAAGAVSLEIGEGGGADALDLTGSASLAGTLEVSLADAAGLSLGDEIDLILADLGVSGTFDTELLPTLGGGLSFDLLYDANRVALLVVADLDGDYNGDGVVDAADYTVWRDGGSPDSSQAGYELWAANYGATSADSPANAVPEPAAGLMLLAALALVVGRRRLL
ncbi:hypothetical protein Pla108_15490 [Botrimarina colliarenosi]|uniref:Autotransporter-associated beta strand repeat protein n=1 Tax=Botrimarina colliarenosi TaxID=2528001 RepID=A0A5C6AMA0_9BACT|nr:hypothetical protein [Botrimarina colliarenosi]TWU00597.1 hypothetical protein Pla108_15490 [Botrimarina colliarenosi]